MKLEVIDDDSYKIFINDLYIKDIDFSNKDTLGKYVKDIILKLKKIYNITLQGLYEVHIYIIKFIGIILEIKNIDSYFSKTIDLKIIVHNEEDIFLKILKYEIIEKYNNIKYFNNCFYLNVNELDKSDLYNIIEFSKIVYGEKLTLLKHKWVSLT